MLIFWSLVRNSVVLAVYLLFSVACFFTVHEHSIKEYPVNQEKIIQLTSQYISNTVSDYLTDYYYKSKSSTIRPYDMEKMLATYISFTVFHKQKLSFNSFIRFAFDYSIYNRDETNAKKLQNFWRDNNLTREEKEGYYVDDSFQGINSYMI